MSNNLKIPYIGEVNKYFLMVVVGVIFVLYYLSPISYIQEKLKPVKTPDKVYNSIDSLERVNNSLDSMIIHYRQDSINNSMKINRADYKINKLRKEIKELNKQNNLLDSLKYRLDSISLTPEELDIYWKLKFKQ